MTTDTPAPTRTRRALRVIGINAGLILAGLTIIEIIFGGWVFGENYGTLVIPKSFTRIFDVERLYGGGRILYKRDEHGLRGEYSDPSAIDILTIGGSTTNEIFVGEGKTWSAVLGRAFREAGRPMTVVNAGVDGQSTIGNIKNFELWFTKIPGLRPRYVLAYLGINDLAVVRGGTKGLDNPHYQTKQDRMRDIFRPVKQYLINNSATYALFRNIRGMIRARDAKLVHNTTAYDDPHWRAPETPPDIDAAARRLATGIGFYEDRLRELAKRIRAHGAEPIFVTQNRGTNRIRDGRVLGRVNAEGEVELPHYADLMAVNRVTMRICREVKAVCIDLARELKFEDGDHYDGLHTTPRGSEKIGRYLFEKLAPLITPG